MQGYNPISAFGRGPAGAIQNRIDAILARKAAQTKASRERVRPSKSKVKTNDHMQMIHDFCEAAGLTRDDVQNVDMTPGWWGRALYYLNATREEPVGVVLAMYFTQEGQMPALNSEIVLPALERHYGHKPTDRAAVFFAEHALADVEHSERQIGENKLF